LLLLTTRRSAGSLVSVARQPLQPPRFISLFIIITLTLATVLPLVALLHRATWVPGLGRTWEGFRALRSPADGSGLLGSGLDTIVVSLRWASIATVASLGFAALAVSGARRWPNVIAVLSSLPVAISGTVLGLGVLLGFGRSPIDWRSSWWMVPMMQSLAAFPYAVRTLRPAAESIEPGLKGAAATLGATPLQVLVHITIPLLKRPIAATAALCAAVSLGEFGATSFLVRPRSETIPVAIAVLSGRPGSLLQAQAAALAVVLAAITLTLGIVVNHAPDDTQGHQ
jgi:thiamine transport system permease protein